MDTKIIIGLQGLEYFFCGRLCRVYASVWRHCSRGDWGYHMVKLSDRAKVRALQKRPENWSRATKDSWKVSRFVLDTLRWFLTRLLCAKNCRRRMSRFELTIFEVFLTSPLSTAPLLQSAEKELSLITSAWCSNVCTLTLLDREKFQKHEALQASTAQISGGPPLEVFCSTFPVPGVTETWPATSKRLLLASHYFPHRQRKMEGSKGQVKAVQTLQSSNPMLLPTEDPLMSTFYVMSEIKHHWIFFLQIQFPRNLFL